MKSPHAGYSRREMLKVTSSSLLVATLPFLSVACSPKKADVDTIARKMSGILNHPQKAHEIAAAYLVRHPEKKSWSYQQITRELLLTLKLDPAEVTEESLLSLDARLREQVQQDFVDENVVIVDSWMLSRTEIMLCLLTAAYS